MAKINKGKENIALYVTRMNFPKIQRFLRKTDEQPNRRLSSKEKIQRNIWNIWKRGFISPVFRWTNDLHLLTHPVWPSFLRHWCRECELLLFLYDLVNKNVHVIPFSNFSFRRSEKRNKKQQYIQDFGCCTVWTSKAVTKMWISINRKIIR